ncbi:MAG: beta-lactamase family protein [Chitinophagaceae bacterium]|uniref:serine hydrolase domain-containing protein n=1 Tax=unclassified Paraflavitalea TaxID=2798305 RepID=UPI003D345046|nr:beta-lactamase family protein [Chitinophagaceae bacterium]
MKNIFLPLFLLIATVVVAQNSSKVLTATTPEAGGFSSERLKRIDDNVQQWLGTGRLNGTVALIVHDGKIVYHKAFGFNDPEKKDPIKKDAIYRIASQTKAITSVAVMMLYEEGKFLLDDPISKYIPEFSKPTVLASFNEKDSSYTTMPAKSEITIRQLLTHTSGIGYAQIGSKESNAIYAKAGITAGFGVPNGHSLAKDMKTLAKLPLMHQPGERYTYGLNTDVLGYLIEVVSGKSLDEFFRTRIFEPLGMKDTYFFLPKEKQARLVTLYEEIDGKVQPAGDTLQYNGVFISKYPNLPGTYLSGGAGLSSTALDYAIFLQMLLNGGEYGGKRLLSRNSVRMMTMNQIGDIDNGVNKFGLGFGITTERGSALLPTPVGVFEWGGAYSTTYWADPKEKIIGIIYRQQWRTGLGEVANKFKVLVYSALN